MAGLETERCCVPIARALHMLVVHVSLSTSPDICTASTFLPFRHGVWKPGSENCGQNHGNRIGEGSGFVVNADVLGQEPCGSTEAWWRKTLIVTSLNTFSNADFSLLPNGAHQDHLSTGSFDRTTLLHEQVYQRADQSAVPRRLEANLEHTV